LIASLLDPLLRWGVHPTSLKKSLGIVLPKPGKKDYNETASYRVIALLPTLSKILERIVAMRLLPIAREKGLIHPNQCGSLPGLSTSDAVAALRHDIGTAHRRGLKASSLMLDVKGGFDNVHPSLLAARLRQAGIPLSLRAWISSFLTDRTVALVFRGGPRDFLPAFMGTPQGSPLSPLLFLIYVSCFHRVRGIGSDRKSTRLNSSHSQSSYAVFCLKKKKKKNKFNNYTKNIISIMFNVTICNPITLL